MKCKNCGEDLFRPFATMMYIHTVTGNWFCYALGDKRGDSHGEPQTQ
jgi:hypothetical protein